MNARALLEHATPRPWRTRNLGRHDSSAIVREGETVALGNTFGGRGAADADLIVAAVNEYEALLDVEEGARQLVRRDIAITVVALCEANLLAALARLDAVRSGT